MKIEKIPEDAVLIPGTVDEYIDRRGNVYGYDHRANHTCTPFIREQSTVYGYKYAKIRGVSTRVHRVVAEVFIPNPDNLPIVMHKNNIKHDNRVENLQWGTVKENTKQASRDKLLVNAKGAEDSQSIPCDMYETVTNKLIASFGSIREAALETGISAGAISAQLRAPSDIRKAAYFTHKDKGSRSHTIVVARDLISGDEVGRYPTIGKASEVTGIPSSIIEYQCRRKKRRIIKGNTAFSYMFLKGEEIIESKKRVE